MQTSKKKTIKRCIAVICIVAVVALLAAMPLLTAKEPEEDGPKASILSGTVSIGSIRSELIGGGTLAAQDAIGLSVPSAVKLTQLLVTNGDTVTAGSAVATVDRVTVMTAISQVQETLEYLSGQIEAVGEQAEQEELTALAGGIVKILYAEEGRSVQSIMLEHGALAVLSLDGLMAVDLETDSTLRVGTSVSVTLSDGTAVTGRIEKNLAGEMTVTVDDDGYAIGEQVSISAEDGSLIGSGALYIYSPWNATAYAGAVESIEAAVGDELGAGDTLMTLSDVGYSASYRQLIAQRQEYEELMLELFELYQTQTLTAPCDGVVSGIDENSAQLLSAGAQGYSLVLLANSPNGDDETVYSNYVGKVTTLAVNGWVLQINPEAIPIEDYLRLDETVADESRMTQIALHTETDIPIFTLTEGAWTLVDRASITSGDILLFAADSEGRLVWSVLLRKGQAEAPSDPGTQSPTDPEADLPDGSTPSDPNSGSGSFPSGGTSDSFPSGGTSDGFPSGGTTGSFPSGGTSGSFPSGGMTEQESAFELYGMEMTQIATVTPQESMTLDISVDELDITALQLGMSAQVQIDALGGEVFSATISQIGTVGSSNGGSSKFTVQLSMEKAENMLSGMNATATIVLSSTDSVLTVPADALVETGTQTVVYTGFDEETETLTDPVAVRVGSSDGETVEILEGLTEGLTYYYAYYDTPEYSVTPDFGGGGFMFG